jgi:hypothetical protein
MQAQATEFSGTAESEFRISSFLIHNSYFRLYPQVQSGDASRTAFLIPPFSPRFIDLYKRRLEVSGDTPARVILLHAT